MGIDETKQKLASIVRGHNLRHYRNSPLECADENGNRCGWKSSVLSARDGSVQALHARHIAEVIQAEFDVLPKGELQRETKTGRVEVNGGPELVRVSRLATDWKLADL